MLTFTSLGNHIVRVTGGERALVAFPVDPSQVKDGIALLPSPQESPAPELISWPGEYNEAGMSIKGIGHVEGQQVSYVVEVEGVRIAFPSLPLQDWTDKQLEIAGDVDVLVLPMSDQRLAQKLVDELDPRVLILLSVGDKAQSDIVKAVGAKNESVSEYKLKGSLPAEGREVVMLNK